MIGTSVKIAIRPPDAAKIVKQIRYGTAVGLTKTAKEGQTAVQRSVKGEFTYRNNWLPQSNKFGIKVKSAKPNDLSAEVRTQADWLEKQRKGGRLTSSTRVRMFRYTFGGKRFIAAPARELRPRGSTKVIKRALWPSTLRKKKGTFVLKLKKANHGEHALFSRFAPGKDGYAFMYILRPEITVKKVDTFKEPIEKVVKRRIDKIISREISNALARMR